MDFSHCQRIQASRRRRIVARRRVGQFFHRDVSGWGAP